MCSSDDQSSGCQTHFYLIVNDRDLALKIRLLFSITIQLSVVDYILQLIVVKSTIFCKILK